jgi:hypothetical protein
MIIGSLCGGKLVNHIVRHLKAKKKKKNENSNISSCKNIIFEKSSKTNPKSFKIL